MTQPIAVSSLPAIDAATAPADAGAAVEARVNYLIPPLGRNAVHVVPPGTGESKREGEYASTPVMIRDARLNKPAPTLDENGFAFTGQVSVVRDFRDDDEVRSVYYPEMTSLVRRATGAREVVVFDHNIRLDGGAPVANSRTPVRTVHNDYTERSAPQRVRDLLGDEQADTLLKKRFAVVNVWRSIAGVVQTAPLGVIDAASIRPSDLIPTDLIYADRVGEIYEVAGNPAHRWYYIPGIEEDEVLFIKGFDSRREVARFTPHSAFDDPGTLPGAPPRQSIEIRSLVFY